MDIDGFNYSPGRKISSNTAHDSLSMFQLGPYLTQTFFAISNRLNWISDIIWLMQLQHEWGDDTTYLPLSLNHYMCEAMKFRCIAES